MELARSIHEHKGIWFAVLFSVAMLSNMLVARTFRGTKLISFNVLSYYTVFHSIASRYFAGFTFFAVIVYIGVNALLVWIIIKLLCSRISPFGWIVFVLYILTIIPDIDYSKFTL